MTERVFEKQNIDWFRAQVGKSVIMKTKEQVMPVGDVNDAEALFTLQETSNTMLFAEATDAEVTKATEAEAPVGELNEAAANT